MSEQTPPAAAGPVELVLGLVPERDDLGWHALNYRTAHTLHAEAMWQELAACVERRVSAAVAAERTQRELVFAELLTEQCEHARAKYALRDLVQALDAGDSLAAAEAMSAAEALLGPNVGAKRGGTACRDGSA